ncbi:MAG: UDP-N-acetylmuramoyl-L-alanine--D-glutamate ligase [Gammaproteobacteria bacterium]|nr:UDP-N-acetylmuramoyl-L-alanine--D-glutamate ligase [Gammaproteobacteria bacterium]
MIVGLGVTGLSVARYLRDRDVLFAVVDSRENPPGKEELEIEFPEVTSHFGAFKEIFFKQASQLIVSPGVSILTPEVQVAHNPTDDSLGAEIVGDIELFVRNVHQPVVAITGSNGKTTVTLLLSLMAEKSGKRALTGGNVGIPVLQLLDQEQADLYILELSSFQLETTYSMNAVAAVILNVSEDHLDRYDGFDSYVAAKARIYDQCQMPIVNRDDERVSRLAGINESVSFGLGEPNRDQDFGLIEKNGKKYLAKGKQCLMPIDEIKIPGLHNVCNALSALALGDQAGLSMEGMLEALRDFEGVEHRSQWIAYINHVNWYNDSKGTNVGATVAALAGMSGNKTVLIAGGQGKGSDFTPLEAVVSKKARAVILMGEDAGKLAEAFKAFPHTFFVSTMQEAVNLAAEQAQENDNVLLSPACASFDMFKNFEERGDVFVEAVRKLSHA